MKKKYRFFDPVTGETPLKYMARYILKAFFLTTFPSTQKQCPKMYAVTLVLPLKLTTILNF